MTARWLDAFLNLHACRVLDYLGPVNTTGVGGVVDENRPRLGGGRGPRLFLGEDDNEVWACFPLAEFVESISPELHHHNAIVDVLRMVINGGDLL